MRLRPRAGRPSGKADAHHPTVLIGPEGGWSQAERRQLPSIRLTTSVLRSETAAIAAAALLAALRDKMISAV